MVNAVDFANVVFQTIMTELELMRNVFSLLLSDSIDVIDIWNVTYHATSFGYWVTKSLAGEGGILDAASKDASAMKNFSYMTNYLGEKAEVIFGNVAGSKGISAVMNNVSTMVDERFAAEFWRTVRTGVELAVRMMDQIKYAFR